MYPVSLLPFRLLGILPVPSPEQTLTLPPSPLFLHLTTLIQAVGIATASALVSQESLTPVGSRHSPASKSKPPGAPSRGREENTDAIKPLLNILALFSPTLPVSHSILTPGHVCAHPRASARAALSAENILPEMLTNGSLLITRSQHTRHPLQEALLD